MARIKYR